MPIKVHQFACLSDNYGYLVRDEATGETAAVDTPDADAVLEALEQTGWTLSTIMNTHWHPDHTGGNAKLTVHTGAVVVGPKEVSRVSPIDRTLSEGDDLLLGETTFRVMDTGGHTHGHISYYSADDHVVFVGDTLFALGCGRLFEGTAEQMWASLSKLAALPDETTVYCAHEYTASNARFALSIDHSDALKSRADDVFKARERNEPTVPTAIGVEKATNPFLRAPLLAAAVGLTNPTPAMAFAAVRAAKDAFRG